MFFEVVVQKAQCFMGNRYRAVGHALRGLWFCLKTDTHFRLHIGAVVAVTSCGLLLGLSAAEWLVAGACMVAVLAAEAINVAIEQLCNAVSADFHPLIKRTKDAAAGAVLLTVLGSSVAGAYIFFPKMITLIQTI
jgi:diacylglycerol kinase